MLPRQLFEMIPKSTFIHRLDARVKIIFVVIICFSAILISAPFTLYILLLCILTLHIFAKTSLEKWAVLIFIMLAGIWGSVISQAIFYAQEPRTPLFCIVTANIERLYFQEGLYLYKEGMIYGSLQAMRSAIMLSAGMLLCWTTDTRDLLKSLMHWRMPYPLAFMTISSLRFLPDIVSETLTVITAQRLRGFSPRKSLWPKKIVQTFYQILFPVLARTIRRAATLSLSVEARGFGRTRINKQTMNDLGGQQIFIGIVGIGFALLVAVKCLYWLQFGGIWYEAKFRSIYDIAKLWL